MDPSQAVSSMVISDNYCARDFVSHYCFNEILNPHRCILMCTVLLFMFAFNRKQPKKYNKRLARLTAAGTYPNQIQSHDVTCNHLSLALFISAMIRVQELLSIKGPQFP